MKINRERILNILQVSSVGLTKAEVLEQSSTFVFTETELVTFSGEILTRVKKPIDIEGAIPAQEMMRILQKLPDEEVDIVAKGDEIRIKGGKRREACITRAAGIALPFEDVPQGKKWRKCPQKVMGILQQAARVCGKDETQPRTTEVHVTPTAVEASDNFRLFHYQTPTGFPEEALIPAASLAAIGGIPIRAVALSKGWVHFKAKTGHRISLRGSSGEYPDLTDLLRMANPTRVSLPNNLTDILSRAEVMQESSYDALVSISLKAGKMILKTKKETGWYREQRQVDYSGSPLRFLVNPKFLEEIFSKKKSVAVGDGRMRIKAKRATFIVCLDMGEESE